MDKLPDLDRAGRNLPQAYASDNALAMPYGYPGEEMDDDGLDLKEIWRIISKYRRTILLFTAIVLITTLAATLMMRPVYKATAVIEVDPQQRSIVRFQNVDEIDVNPRAYQQTQARIIQSESVAQAVVERLNLESNTLFTGAQDERGLISGLRQIADTWLSPLFAGLRALLTNQQSAAQSASAELTDPLLESGLAPAPQQLVGRVLGGKFVHITGP